MTQRDQPGTSEERLLLEEKLVQRQLRLMRSKLLTITTGWYNAATFDLIRSGWGRTTFPSRGRLFSVPAGFCIEFAAQALQPGGRGMPPPLQCIASGPPEIRAHRNKKAAGTTCGFRMKEIRGEEKMKKKKQLKFCSASLLCSFIIPGKCEERKW